MGTGYALLILQVFTYLTRAQVDTETTTVAVSNSVSSTFLNSQVDFISGGENGEFFPLEQALQIKNALLDMEDSNLEDLVDTSESQFVGYRNYKNMEKEVATSDNYSNLALPMKIAVPLDMAAIIAKINKNPTDLNLLHRSSQVLQTEGSVADKDTFLSDLIVPEVILSELEFISGYKFNVTSSSSDYSASSVARLPVDSILSISQDWFNQQDLEIKLKENTFVPKSSSLAAWSSVLDKYMTESEIVDNFDAYSSLLLSSSITKILEKMKDFTAAKRMSVLESHNLDAVKVQAIWDSIKSDALALEEIDEQAVSSLFFAIGNKLDIYQIDKFYTETFAHLYSKRHEVEELWIHNENLDIPWPTLKYIAALHWPSVSTDQWAQKELLDLGAFGVALTRDQLQDIPDAAFARVSTVKNLFSNRLSLGQLYVIFDKINEGATENFDLPAHLYPCLHSSLLNGEEAAGKMRISQGIENFIKASKMFTPAQLAAYVDHLKPDLWTKENLSLVLLHNPSMLHMLSIKEFVSHLEDLMAAIKYSGRTNFQQIVDSIRALPKKYLQAWLLKTVVDENGNLDVNTLLDETSSADYFERVKESTYGSSLALPGMCCSLIDKIPADRLMQVLSVYRASLPGEVVPSDARMCFVSAIRSYLKIKADSVSQQVSSEIEVMSMLSSSDIRAIGAELLLTWGSNVLTNIPHPEVSYEILLKIGEEYPHLFFHNGVTPPDVKMMALQLFKLLKQKNNGIVDISVLKKLGSFLPYLEIDLDVSAEKIRQVISTVYSDKLMRGVCMCAEQRAKFAEIIVKGYGDPSTWSSDDLVQLGDLLVNFPQSQLLQVKPDALRKALPSLVKSSIYSSVLLPEVRGHVAPQLYYIACQEWLSTDVEDGEETFSSAWQTLARWHMSGASLLASALANSSPSPRTEVRRKRDLLLSRKKREDTVDYMKLHDKVMDILMQRYNTLTAEQKEASKVIITDSQELIGNGTLALLGLDPTKMSLSQANVLKTIEEKKQAGLTAEQQSGIVEIAKDAQVRLVQDLSNLMGLTADDLGLDQQTFDDIKAIDTFGETELFMSTAVYDFTATATTADPGSIPAETTTESINNLITEEENLVHSLAVEIPDLSTVKVTCDMIRTAASSSSMLTSADIYSMEAQEVRDCIEVLGGLQYSPDKAEALWPTLKAKLGVSSFSEGDMVLLRNLLSVVASNDLDLLNLSKENIDAVSVLGQVSTLTTEEAREVMDKYLEPKENHILSELELKSLGRLLCGLTESHWSVQKQEYLMNAVDQIATADCAISKAIGSALKRRFSEVTEKLDYGWLTPYIWDSNMIDFRELPSSVTQNMHDLDNYSAQSLGSLNPQAASLIPADAIQQLTDTAKLTALAQSTGEDPVLREVLTDKLVQELGQYPPPLQQPTELPVQGKQDDDSMGARESAATSLILLSIALCFILG